jgi:hypothetical protein
LCVTSPLPHSTQLPTCRTQACLPDPESLSAPPPAGAASDPEEAEAAAWRTSAGAAALHVLLLELLSVPASAPAARTSGGGAAPAGGSSGSLLALPAPPAADDAAASGARQLLDGWGPAQLGALLAAAAAPLVSARLLESVLALTQAAYLQLGSVGLRGAWSDIQHDAVGAAGELRAEVAPLLAALARGEYETADLEAACQILAAQAAAAHAGGTPGASPGAAASPGGGGGGRGASLAEALRREPLGRVLLGAAAVTPVSLTPCGTEYGRAFLYDAGEVEQLLGSFLMEDMGTAGALAVILGDLGTGASLSHARLALLQAASSMVACLPRNAGARKQLAAPGAGNDLLRSCVKVSCLREGGGRRPTASLAGACIHLPALTACNSPERPTQTPVFSTSQPTTAQQATQSAAAEYQRLTASPASRLLIAPWALPILGRASSEAVLLCARTLLAAVRLWKATHARAGAAGSAAAASGAAPAPAARPALLMRMGSSASRTVGPPGRAGAAAAAGSSGDDAPELAAMQGAQHVASLLADWLRSRAAADGPGRQRPEAWAADEVTQCLCTCLLLLLQETPEAAGAVEEPTTGGEGGGGTRGDRSGLQLALLDVLPVLCAACAAAAAAKGGDHSGGDRDGAQRAAVLQLLIEILQRQLAPPQWLPHVGAHLALVPMLRTTCWAASTGSGGQEAEVCHISVLELLLCVSTVPEGALQLFQQGALPALMDCARDLLDPSGGGLLGPEAVGPDGSSGGGDVAMGGGGASAGGPAVPGTLGAYRQGGAGGGGAGAWSPEHQQWCVLLGLAGTMLRHLSRFVPVSEAAVSLMVAVEPRVVLAMQLMLQQLPQHRGGGSSGGGDAGALQVQLATLLEAERSLALLCLLAQHAGAWQVARPGALAMFRAAAAGVVEFAARPSIERCGGDWGLGLLGGLYKDCIV